MNQQSINLVFPFKLLILMILITIEDLIFLHDFINLVLIFIISFVGVFFSLIFLYCLPHP